MTDPELITELTAMRARLEEIIAALRAVQPAANGSGRASLPSFGSYLDACVYADFKEQSGFCKYLVQQAGNRWEVRRICR